MNRPARIGLPVFLVAALACSGGGGDDTNPATDTGPLDTEGGDPGGQDLLLDTSVDPGPTPKDLIEGTADEVLPDPGADPVVVEDGGPTVPGPHPLFEFTGKIEISETPAPGGGSQNSGVGALIWDAPPDTTHTLVNEMGDCQYWLVILEQDCDPECGFGQYCGTDGQCHPDRDRVGAGTITVSGIAVEVQAVPDDTDYYVTQGDTPDDLFGPGDTIAVSATGDEIPAFEETLQGVGDLMAPWAHGTLDLVDGADLILPWEVQGDGSTVELAVRTGWHGAPPIAIIWCSAPDQAGAITIPQMFVEAFPVAGGMGLFPWNSVARRVNRKVVEGPYGPIEIRVGSRQTFSITHNPP